MKTKIKFVNVPIGARLLSKHNQVNIKLDDELAFNWTCGHLENFDNDEEVSLITKCAKCNLQNKCNIAKFMLGDNTFSCSLFELKENADGK